MDLNNFLVNYSIKLSDFRKTKIKWNDLCQLKKHYEQTLDSLNQVADDISIRARRFSNKVHSVKFRVKDSEHLIAKIIRKRIENPKRIIDIKNYQKEITDLIGVRVLHLFKEDWSEIHSKIKESWNFYQRPVAYYRDGDSKGYQHLYSEKGCEMKIHKYGYRSVHYLVSTSPLREINVVEIQVRTLFEEAWSEIDHKIRYPYDLENPLLKPYLDLFNRSAGSADEMGSYVMFLQQKIADIHDESGRAIKKLEERIKKMTKRSKDKSIKISDVSDIQKDLKDINKRIFLEWSHSPPSQIWSPNPVNIFSDVNVDEALNMAKRKNDLPQHSLKQKKKSKKHSARKTKVKPNMKRKR